MTDLDLFFEYLRDICHAICQLKSKNRVFFWPIHFVALQFGNGLQYCNSDFKRLDRMNLSTILVTFGPEIPEFMLLTKIAPFAAIWQNSAYHVKYLKMSWTYLDLLYRFCRRISRDDFSDIRLAIAQGTLLWQPVKYERCSQTLHGTTVTLCFAIWQQIGRS